MVFHRLGESGKCFDSLFKDNGLLQQSIVRQLLYLGVMVAPEHCEDRLMFLLEHLKSAKRVFNQCFGAPHELLVDIVLANPMRWVQVQTFWFCPLFTDNLIPLLECANVW